MNSMPDGYSTAARMMHWIVALLVLLMIPAGFVMVQKGIGRLLQDTLFLFHKNAGLLLFLIVVARLLYRQVNPPPALPADLPEWQCRAALLSHRGLYLLLLMMPIAGYVRVRAGRFPIEALDAMGIGTMLPRSDSLAGLAHWVHYVGAFALSGLLLVHVGAALHHAFIRRDGVFSRMWPPFGR